VTVDAFTRGRYQDGAQTRPVLVWRFAAPRRVVSSAPMGGGIGVRGWIINAQVPLSYARTDVDAHLRSIAAANRCDGDGVGMLTAASVEFVTDAVDDDVHAWATVGLRVPTWAAAAPDVEAVDTVDTFRPGTINVVVTVPARLADAALVNAVMTATEAKTQALLDAGVDGTGTASDAVCVVCPIDGAVEPFAGPRSHVGAPLARAVYEAVRRGAGTERS
jgi:adenosylcobinamide hydrolase